MDSDIASVRERRRNQRNFLPLDALLPHPPLLPMWPLVNFKQEKRALQETAPTLDRDLCHSYALRALALGESLKRIGKLLGHTQVHTAVRYAHFADGHLLDAAEIIGSVLLRAMYSKK